MKTIPNIKKALLTVSALAFTCSTYAQDLRFTQALSNPLKLNPSMMGINPDLKFIFQSRSQWGAIDKSFATHSFSALYPVYINKGKEKLDIGFNALNDKAGAFNALDFSLAIGYNLQVSEASYINLALTGGYIQKSLNTANLTFDEQYVLGSYSANNPNSETILDQKAGHPDVGFGAMWYYNPTKADGGKINAYLGISAFHLNRPNESFTGITGTLPARYSFQGGIKILGENKIDFTPNIIINSQQGNENIAAGLLTDYRLGETSKLVLGLWYRRSDAIAFSLGFDHRTFAFAYSYDVVTSQVSNFVTGLNAHEITLSLKFNQSEKKGIKANPSFF